MDERKPEPLPVLNTPRLLSSSEAITGCGAGQGRNCCTFLLSGEHGVECGRGGEKTVELAARAIFHKHMAQRIPTETYPGCQREFKTAEKAA